MLVCRFEPFRIEESEITTDGVQKASDRYTDGESVFGEIPRRTGFFDCAAISGAKKAQLMRMCDAYLDT